MSKTEVSGKQVKDGSIELVDLSTSLANTISGKADAGSLAAVATSGSYNDLADKPSIPSVSGLASETYVNNAVAGKADSSSLATVATSGSYNDLTNKPSIPSISGLATETYVDTKVADLVASAPTTLDTLNELATALGNDANFSTTITNALAAKASTSSLATVATSGSYDDLSNKPIVPSTLDDLSDVVVTSATKGQFIVHNGTNFVNARTIEANAATTVPLIVKGAASQTANLLELQNSSGTVMTSMGVDGSISGNYGYFITTGNDSFPLYVRRPSVPTRPGFVVFDASWKRLFAVGNDARYTGAYAGLGGFVEIGSSEYSFTTLGYHTSSNALRVVSNSNTAMSFQSPDGGYGQYTLTIARDTTKTTWDFTGQSINFGPKVGVNLSAAPTAQFQVNAGAAATKGVIVQGAASQTANLLELQNSSGTSLFSVSSAGVVSNSVDTNTLGATTITTTAAATVPLVLKGAASQTAPFFETQNSAGTWQHRFQSNGTLRFNYAASSTPILVSNFWDERMFAVDIGANSATANSTIQIGTQAYQFATFGFEGGTGSNGCFKIWGRVNRCFAFQSPDDGAGIYQFDITRNLSSGLWNFNRGGTCYGFNFNVPNVTNGGMGVNLTAYPGATFHVVNNLAARKAMIVQGVASQTANLFEAQDSSANALVTISSGGALHAKRYTETVANAFDTSLAPSSGTLTVDTSTGNAVLGALNAAVTTWAFTNVPTDNSKVTTVTAVLAGNASYTYGDACSVNGSSVSGGIMWSGGAAPTATAGTDIITFIIVKDSAGTVKVFGSATTNFS